MKLVKCMNCAYEKFVKDSVTVATCPICIIQMVAIPYDEKESYRVVRKEKR